MAEIKSVALLARNRLVLASAAACASRLCSCRSGRSRLLLLLGRVVRLRPLVEESRRKEPSLFGASLRLASSGGGGLLLRAGRRSRRVQLERLAGRAPAAAGPDLAEGARHSSAGRVAGERGVGAAAARPRRARNEPVAVAEADAAEEALVVGKSEQPISLRAARRPFDGCGEPIDWLAGRIQLGGARRMVPSGGGGRDKTRAEGCAEQANTTPRSTPRFAPRTWRRRRTR